MNAKFTTFPFKKSELLEIVIQDFREELENELDQARQNDLQRLIQMFRFLPKREYLLDDVIIPSSLVCLSYEQVVSYSLLTPSLQGLHPQFRGVKILQVQGNPVSIMSDESLLGSALLGKKAGDTLQVQVADKIRSYEILGMI